MIRRRFAVHTMMALRDRSIVFLHGIGGSARAWTPQLESFARAGFHPAALDLPGFGARPPVETMQFEELAAGVEAAIARPGLARPLRGGPFFGRVVGRSCARGS